MTDIIRNIFLALILVMLSFGVDALRDINDTIIHYH